MGEKKKKKSKWPSRELKSIYYTRSFCAAFIHHDRTADNCKFQLPLNYRPWLCSHARRWGCNRLSYGSRVKKVGSVTCAWMISDALSISLKPSNTECLSPYPFAFSSEGSYLEEGWGRKLYKYAGSWKEVHLRVRKTNHSGVVSTCPFVF